jgi:hypothetical protein
MGFYVECPKISSRPHLQRKPQSKVSPQGWTGPHVLWLENLLRKCSSSQARKTTWAMMLLINSLGQNLPSIPRLSPSSYTFACINLDYLYLIYL